MAIQKHRVVSAVYKNVRRYGGEVKNLPRNDAYTLHKSARVRFRRRKTYSKGPGDLFQIDLVDLGNISSHNDGYRYSRDSTLVLLGRIQQTCVGRRDKNKDRWRGEPSLGKNISRPNMVQSDKGTEFLNSTFQSMLKRHDIKFYTSENEDIKAAVVERFNRTLMLISE